MIIKVISLRDFDQEYVPNCESGILNLQILLLGISQVDNYVAIALTNICQTFLFPCSDLNSVVERTKKLKVSKFVTDVNRAAESTSPSGPNAKQSQSIV